MNKAHAFYMVMFFWGCCGAVYCIGAPLLYALRRPMATRIRR